VFQDSEGNFWEIAPAKGALQIRAKEIRPEITSSALTLHIIYEFVKG